MSKRLLSLIACFWLGAICAITLSAKIKFNAPLLDLRTGLDVGRTVFAVFDQFQWFLMLALLFAALYTKTKCLLIPCLLILIIFSLQSWYLLPQLTAQAQLYIALGQHLGNDHHIIYLLVELGKSALLLLLTFLCLKKPMELFNEAL